LIAATRSISTGAPSAAMRAAGLADAAEAEAPTDPVPEKVRALPLSRNREASMAALIFWPTDLIMA
jgi:hypothetical protein